MAKTRGRRGFSLGTVFMSLVTILCVAMGLWIFPRIAGSLEDVRLSPAGLIQGLIPGATPQAGPTEPLPGTDPQANAPSPTPAPQTTPAPTARRLVISAAGQIGLDNTLRKSGLQESGNYHYGEIFADIAPYMAAADIALVTLETTTAGEAQGYDSYNAPVALLDALKSAGVDTLNLATERILDKGVAGLAATRAAAEQRGFGITGAHRSASEQALPLNFEINGIKVACLSYTYGLSSTGGKQGTAEERAWAVNLLEVERIRADVALARSQGANLVIVNVHWGKRAQTKPSGETLAYAEQIASCGADVILGTHPTSVHSLERKTVTLADGTPHEVFIAYSLGNFLTNERDETATIMGTLLTLEFTLEPGETQARLSDARYLPTWVMRYQSDGYHYRIIPAGTGQKPPEMTDSIYKNMTRAYENQVKTLGTDAATPYAE